MSGFSWETAWVYCNWGLGDTDLTTGRRCCVATVRDFSGKLFYITCSFSRLGLGLFPQLCQCSFGLLFTNIGLLCLIIFCVVSLFDNTLCHYLLSRSVWRCSCRWRHCRELGASVCCWTQLLDCVFGNRCLRVCRPRVVIRTGPVRTYTFVCECVVRVSGCICGYWFISVILKFITFVPFGYRF